MKFICQSCGREFDIGAPKGMQLPCPACGGMLTDEESAAGGAPAQPSPPASEPAAPSVPSAAAFSAPAEETEPDEFSLEAAERFAAAGGSGGEPPAAVPSGGQPAAEPQSPEPVQPPAPQEALPPTGAEESYQEAPEAPQEWAEQPGPQPMPQPGAESYEYEEQPPPSEAGAEEYYQAEDAALPPQEAGEEAYEDEGYPPEASPEEGYVPEGEEEFAEEEAAHPVVLMLGWVLFGVTLVGVLVMGYFLKQYSNKAKAGAGSAADRVRVAELEKEITEQANVVQDYRNDRDKANERADKLDEEVKVLRAKVSRYQAKTQDTAAASKALESAHRSNVEALGKLNKKFEELRRRAEGWEAKAERRARRLRAATLALRAAGFVDRPALWGEALGSLDAATSADGELDAAWMLKGRILARAGQPEKAVAAFDRVDRLARNAGAEGHARALVAAGDVCRTQLKDERRAAGFYSRASQAAPDSAYGRLGDIRELMLAGDLEAAVGNIEDGIKAVEKADADATPLRMAQAEALATSEEDRAGAIEAVSAVIAADPVLVPALDLRARLLREDKQLHAAVRDLARAAELDPSNGERLASLGKMFLELGRPEAAEPILRRAVELRRESVDALTALGRALVGVGKQEEALLPLSEVLQLDEDNVEARRLKGEARVALGRYREGLYDLEQSLKLGQDDIHVRLLLARTYARARDVQWRIPRKAILHAQRAVNLSGERNAEALSTLAEAYAAAGSFARAEIQMRSAVKLDPENENYRIMLQAYKDKAR